MSTEFISNMEGVRNSLLISRMGDITSGATFTPGCFFLIKNNTEDNISATITLAKGTLVTTTLYPGWNPEICLEVISAPSGLQYGY